MRKFLFLLPLVLLLLPISYVLAGEDSEGNAQVGRGGGGNQTITQGSASVKGAEELYIYDFVISMGVALMLAMLFGIIFALVLHKGSEEGEEYEFEYYGD